MSTSSPEDFYVGWSESPPAATMAFVRRRVFLATLAAALVAVILAASQRAFARSNFEFGVERSFEGVIEHVPFPTLVVQRPGADRQPTSRWLLTVFGKHGAEAATEAFVGHRVRVKGSLIHRGDTVMVEISPESIEDLGESTVGGGSDRPVVEAEVATFRGEIVDSKCFLGVMKPGNLKPHRACAARCISGGVPPVLLVRGEDGVATYLLLVGADGEAINQDVLPFVAEPVELKGRLGTLGDMQLLRADPSSIQRIGDL